MVLLNKTKNDYKLFLEAKKIQDAKNELERKENERIAEANKYPGLVKIGSNYWQNQNVELGIISNFDSRLYHLLVALELENYFQSVTLSSASQTAKPETPIFQQALAKHRSQPHQAWHIGDSFREDYQGAERAGLKACLIERSG